MKIDENRIIVGSLLYWPCRNWTFWTFYANSNIASNKCLSLSQKKVMISINAWAFIRIFTGSCPKLGLLHDTVRTFFCTRQWPPLINKTETLMKQQDRVFSLTLLNPVDSSCLEDRISLFVTSGVSCVLLDFFYFKRHFCMQCTVWWQLPQFAASDLCLHCLPIGPISETIDTNGLKDLIDKNKKLDIS